MAKSGIKVIGRSNAIELEGLALVRQIFARMGWIFYETGGVEAGIDGIVEIRDDDSGRVRNFILQVQVKTTSRRLANDDGSTFTFACEEADIAYWREGTAPVLLIVVSTVEAKAWFKPIKEWFSSPERIAARRIVFDRTSDEFRVDAKAALAGVAASAVPGAIPPSVRRNERLTLNLLRATFGPRLFLAPTTHADNGAFGAALRQRAPTATGEWTVKGGSVLSFHPLDQAPWRHLCEPGAMEEFDVTEWSDSDDDDRLRDFVALLNRALNALVEPDMRWDKEDRLHYFVKQPGRTATKIGRRAVVQRYGMKKNPTSTAFWRHSAFMGRFLRLGGQWHLEVTPTYRFTADGYTRSRFSGDYLAGIKQLENNDAVSSQFETFREFLCARKRGDLVEAAYPFLKLDPLEPFSLPWGVPDEVWRSTTELAETPLFDWVESDR